MNLDYVILWVSQRNNYNTLYKVNLQKFDTVKSLLKKCCKKFKLNPLYYSIYTIEYYSKNILFSENYKLVTDNNLNDLFNIYSAKRICIDINYTNDEFKTLANKGLDLFTKYL